jgi:ubiquinone/menaquinone biosynthesis C-methylase UbiE
MEPRGDLKIANYLLAVEGLAMIRDFLTDPEALEPRAAEVAAIASGADEGILARRIPVHRYDVASGYERWAPRYDGPNPAIEAEEPIVRELVGRLAPGVALDAACGTGRHAAHLAAQGWQVIGVDATEAMLERARAKVPAADLRAGRLQDLPVDDESVDLVTCGLALTHVDDLEPVFDELARVLRPGGRVVTSDIHPVMAMTGGMAAFPIGDTEPGRPGPAEIHFVPNLVHHVSAYVDAFGATGLRILGCHEPAVSDAFVESFPSYAAFPEATREAFGGLPYLLIWELTKG